MEPRNIIELAVLLAVIIIGIVAFLILKRKASAYEADLNIQEKKDLRGKKE